MTQAVTVGLCGQAVLADRLLNKDTAFSEEECDGLGLRGLLPPGVLTLEQQVCLELGHVHRKSDSDLPDEFAGQLREARLPVGPSRSPRAASGRLQLDRPATRRH